MLLLFAFFGHLNNNRFLIGKKLLIVGTIGEDTIESTRVWLDYTESVPFPQFLG